MNALLFSSDDMTEMNCIPIGKIRTPYITIEECPRNLMYDGPPCRIVVDPEYADGLYGLGPGASILILYWLDKASFSKLLNTSRKTGETRGIFSLRTPHRPNPIAAAVVRIDEIAGAEITVRGLDCIDKTILLDIKPALVNEVDKSRNRRKFLFWRS